MKEWKQKRFPMKCKTIIFIFLALSQAVPMQALSPQEIQTWGTIIIAAPFAFQAAAQLTRRDEKIGQHRPLIKSAIGLLTIATAYVLLGPYAVKELASHLG